MFKVELAGNDNHETGIWMEPFSNGLKYNPHTDELFICEHGRRAIGAITKDGKWRQVANITLTYLQSNRASCLIKQCGTKITRALYMTSPFYNLIRQYSTGMINTIS